MSVFVKYSSNKANNIKHMLKPQSIPSPTICLWPFMYQGQMTNHIFYYLNLTAQNQIKVGTISGVLRRKADLMFNPVPRYFRDQLFIFSAVIVESRIHILAKAKFVVRKITQNSLSSLTVECLLSHVENVKPLKALWLKRQKNALMTQKKRLRLTFAPFSLITFENKNYIK